MLEVREPCSFPKTSEALDKKWEAAFQGFKRQLEIGLDTGLSFGNEIEVYLSYEGRQYRWVNSVDGFLTLLICPYNDPDLEATHNAAMSFVSYLVFETRQPIRICNNTMYIVRRLPFNATKASSNKVRYPSDYDRYLKDDVAAPEHLRMAYAFFKEGINSASPYYGFLSFFKVLQFAFQENGTAINTWINANLVTVLQADEINGLQQRAAGIDVAEYLYKSSRCAIAHTKLNQIVVNPDNVDDYYRILADMYVMSGLARHVINTKAGILR